MKRRARHVWFFSFPGSEMLDLSGPWSVLGYANEVMGREAYTSHLIAPLGREIRTRHGLVLRGARSLGDVAAIRAPDMVVVAGGATASKLPSSEARVVRWLRQCHRSIPTLVSICTGAFVLGEVGLLNGRRATTHWQYVDALRKRFPKARVVDDDMFLRDGRVWTSAGITAGIDLMLALVEEEHGHAVAMAVAKALVLFLRRSGRQAQFSQILKRQEGEPARLRDLSAFIFEHLNQPLSLERLARNVGMSVRTLTPRRCEHPVEALYSLPRCHASRLSSAFRSVHYHKLSFAQAEDPIAPFAQNILIDLHVCLRLVSISIPDSPRANPSSV